MTLKSIALTAACMAAALSAAELGDYVAPIPEPGSFALIGLGLAGLAGLRRRRQ